MVALRTIPTGDEPTPSAFADDDLVIALEPDAALDGAGAAALVEAAATDAADAFFGDIEVDGVRTRRAAWSPTRLRSDPVAASPIAVRAGWLRRHDVSGGDPALPLLLAAGDARVGHLPATLSRHRRPPAAPSALDLGRVATPPTLTERPRIDVVVPSAGFPVEPGGPMALRGLLDSLAPVDGVAFTVVVGDEFVGDRAFLRTRPDVSLVERPHGPFNFSAAVNLGILRSTADRILLLNDDIEAVDADAIHTMAAHLDDPDVAAVGALLTYPDGTIQHAGVIIDDARPLHPFVGWSPEDAARHGGLLAREVVAVTGACLLARRRDLLAVGGLSVGFPLSFNDIDLCIRLQRTVGRVVVEPAARFVHHETVTREPAIAADEWDRWIDRWGEIVDPWYHPGWLRPDDPHRLHRNADHLEPIDDLAPDASLVRYPELTSRVHRGRAASSPR
ncbi:MAG: hypothetical protein AAF548_05100 [Actinomycetota bacterium]